MPAKRAACITRFENISRWFHSRIVLLAPTARGGESDALPPAVRDAKAQLLSQFFAQGGASPAVLEYRRKLQEYQAARAAFDEEAGAYWSQIAEKRRGRNAKRRSGQQVTLDDYVLKHPPLYTGPKRPVNPEPEETPERPTRKADSGGRRSPAGRARSSTSSRRSGRPARSSSSAPMRAARSPRG